METHVAALHEAFEPFLTPESGAGWIRLPAGRVLLHGGHQAQGVFVAASGLLRATDSRDRVSDMPSPCVVPRLGEWDIASPFTWSLRSESELLFIPRSRLLEPSGYRTALEQRVLALIAKPVHSAEETR